MTLKGAKSETLRAQVALAGGLRIQAPLSVPQGPMRCVAGPAAHSLAGPVRYRVQPMSFRD